MKKKIVLSSIVLLALFIQTLAQIPDPVQAQASSSETNSEIGLCLPGQEELISTQDCQMEGPAQRLQELAEEGITFPPAPLFITKPPVELGNVPFTYARVSNDVVPLYATVDDAIAGIPNGSLPLSHIKFVSLYNKAETDKGLFYQIANNKWISREFVSKVAIQMFQGELIQDDLATSFGWILDQAISRKEPSINAEVTGKQYTRYDVVHVYDSVMENEIEWVRIGANEWVDHRSISKVVPATERPEGVTSDRWIEINLYEQVLLVYEKDELVFATLISSGTYPFYTQPGVFTIYDKIEHEYMRGAFEADKSDYYYLEDVPYIMYYDQSRALHGAYWHTRFGTEQSHGCVNISVADSHWLYDWANEGDFVYVWDPSGETPTDPSFYGAGGI